MFAHQLLFARLVDHLHGLWLLGGVADTRGAKHLGQVVDGHLAVFTLRYPDTHTYIYVHTPV